MVLPGGNQEQRQRDPDGGGRVDGLRCLAAAAMDRQRADGRRFDGWWAEQCGPAVFTARALDLVGVLDPVEPAHDSVPAAGAASPSGATPAPRSVSSSTPNPASSAAIIRYAATPGVTLPRAISERPAFGASANRTDLRTGTPRR